MKTLEELSDQELSEAFAVEVAGWTKRLDPGKAYFGEGDRPHVYWSSTGRSIDDQAFCYPFATDANAVLPFVQAHDIVCHFVPSNGLWHLRVCFSTPMVFAEATTFARAAVIALLKAQRATP